MICIIGKSGSGKDTIANSLLKHGFTKAELYTTRPSRSNSEYVHLTNEEFFEKIPDMFEHRYYDTVFGRWYYGTKNEIYDNTVVIGATDNHFLFDTVIYIYVDEEVRLKRAKSRPDFNQNEWDRRLKSENEDFKDVKYNLKIENIDIQKTVSEILQYLKGINNQKEAV